MSIAGNASSLSCDEIIQDHSLENVSAWSALWIFPPLEGRITLFVFSSPEAVEVSLSVQFKVHRSTGSAKIRADVSKATKARWAKYRAAKKG